MTRFRCGVALACLVVRFGAVPASAATITVTTTDDEINTDGDCGLREAVRSANTNVAVDACTAGSNTETDTIVVPAGTYTLTIVADVGNTALGGDLDLVDNTAAEDLVIDGAGADVTIIQACPVDQKTAACAGGQGVEDRVFHNLAAHSTIRDVTIRNGRSASGAGDGGGVSNQSSGVLTLDHCIVSDNVTAGSGAAGGGLVNSNGTLSLVDSTITGNSALGGFGGGIRNTGSAVLTVSGSTISNNTATGGGGGLYDSGGTPIATITNSTISGNSSNGGGGVVTGTGTPSVAIHSSTITNNTAAVAFGAKGGGVTPGGGTITLRNSIVAGNFDVSTTNVPSQAPDCSVGGGTLVSEGYNLIGNNKGCSITAVAGDQVGTAAAPLDPLLGPLADNGGPTATHLPLPGSVATGAGNPAAPGSGGFACPTTDQRGVTRPQGAACDPGAVEVANEDAALAVTLVRPAHGGNAGSALTIVYGAGIVDGATVRLTRDGQPDVIGGEAVVERSVVIVTSLDLTGAAPGVWNVVVTNPDATSASLPNAFTVEAGGRADLWVELTMPHRFVFGRTTTVLLTFGNRGNVDAYDVPLWFSFPDELEFHLPFAITPPPAQPGQSIPADWTLEAIDVPIPPPEDRDTLPLLLPIVPAGFSGSLRFRLKAPLAVPAERRPFFLTFDIGQPYLEPDPRPGVVALFVERGKAFATQVFGTTSFPSDAAIEQYVRTQLELVGGRATLDVLEQVGQPSKVYSLAQLMVDVAQFIAGESETIARRDRMPFDGGMLAGLVQQLLLGPNEAEARRIADPDCSPDDLFCEHFDPCEDEPPVPPCGPQDPPIRTCDRVNRFDDVFVFVPCNPSPSPHDLGNSSDPNDKVGPGVANGFVDGLTPIPYAVFFENLANASAAALEVAITDQLDVSKLDLATFSLGPIHFGVTDVVPPPGLTAFTTDVDLRPNKNLLVRIVAGLDAGTGVASWHFTALDPATGEIPEDPLNGFLPPNVTSPQGEGGVQFTISPKSDLALGTSICNDARIVFDFNAPIDTSEWCNVIGEPEDCSNCRDDDGDGQIDRADADCVPGPADGGGAGLTDPDAAKALDKCAKSIRKVGSKLGATRTKLVEGCLKAVADCVQVKPGDDKCLTAARGKCTKAKASLVAADAKGGTAIAKTCGEPAVAPAALAALTGIGFAGEAGICAARGAAGVGTLADVTTCLTLQHACATEHLVSAAVPRAGELLTLGGWDDLACIDHTVDGGGTGVVAAKRKALRKCDLALQKATAALAAGRAKALQACGGAVFACLQTKPGNQPCLDKASGGCAKAAGGLPKLTDKFTAAIAKACNTAPLVFADLLASEGLGFDASCAAAGAPALGSVDEVASCLAGQVACRTDQSLRTETPRLDELLQRGGFP